MIFGAILVYHSCGIAARNLSNPRFTRELGPQIRIFPGVCGVALPSCWHLAKTTKAWDWPRDPHSQFALAAFPLSRTGRCYSDSFQNKPSLRLDCFPKAEGECIVDWSTHDADVLRDPIEKLAYSAHYVRVVINQLCRGLCDHIRSCVFAPFPTSPSALRLSLLQCIE